MKLFFCFITFFCVTTQASELIPFNIDPPKACSYKNLNPPLDTVVLAVSGNDGRKLEFQIDQSGHIATQVDVAVNFPEKPVILVLGAYEPTIWNIGWSLNTNVVAVFATGYHTQKVAGLMSGTPLLTTSNEEYGPCETVGYFSGNKVNEVDEELVKKIFARSISALYSATKGKVIVGKDIVDGQKLVSSKTTTPRSFYIKNVPLVGEAGLKQSQRENKLRRATVADMEEWNAALAKGRARSTSSLANVDATSLFNGWVVLKKFVCPAGLYGTSAANFFVINGVPLPAGKCGHSSFYDFNTMTQQCTADSPCGLQMLRN